MCRHKYIQLYIYKENSREMGRKNISSRISGVLGPSQAAPPGKCLVDRSMLLAGEGGAMRGMRGVPFHKRGIKGGHGKSPEMKVSGREN